MEQQDNIIEPAKLLSRWLNDPIAIVREVDTPEDLAGCLTHQAMATLLGSRRDPFTKVRFDSNEGLPFLQRLHPGVVVELLDSNDFVMYGSVKRIPLEAGDFDTLVSVKDGKVAVYRDKGQVQQEAREIAYLQMLWDLAEYGREQNDENYIRLLYLGLNAAAHTSSDPDKPSYPFIKDPTPEEFVASVKGALDRLREQRTPVIFPEGPATTDGLSETVALGS